MTNASDSWPAGATWVFQGTVAEDATAGTHVCTLTVTPGAGNEILLMGGRVVTGATATSQAMSVHITDGSNILTRVAQETGTVSSIEVSFPEAAAAPSSTTLGTQGAYVPFPISGTMQLVLQVQTTQISVTQTFAVVCRIKGAVPTATLADTVGTPVLTTNTSAVF